MIYIFSFLLMVGSLGYVALPLFRGTREERDAGPGESSELEAQKAAAYTAIKELQFDYELGNLTADDHQDLETKYRRKAARILKELDEMKTQPPVDDLEAEIMRKRKRGRTATDDDLERAIALRRSKAHAGDLEREIALRRGEVQTGAGAAAQACPRCGKPQRAEIKFCTSCGASMAGVKPSCPSCGKPFLAEDRFCPECGASLKKENKQ